MFLRFNQRFLSLTQKNGEGIGTDAAFLLSQIQWRLKANKNVTEGWVEFTQDESWRLMGWSRRTYDSAKQILIDSGIVLIERKLLKGRVHFSLNPDFLFVHIVQPEPALFVQNVQTETSNIAPVCTKRTNSENPVCTKRTVLFVQNVQTEDDSLSTKRIKTPEDNKRERDARTALTTPKINEEIFDDANVEIPSEEKPKKKVFIPPILSEVVAYMKTFRPNISDADRECSAEKFICHWTLERWMRKGRSLVDWQAATRMWVLNDQRYQPKYFNNGKLKSNLSENLNDILERESNEWDAIVQPKQGV